FGGMSQGGYSSMRVAIRWPQRVRGLVLLSTMGTLRPPEGLKMFRDMAATLRAHGFVEPMIEGLAQTLLGEPRFWEPWVSHWRAIDPLAVAAGVDQLVERDDIAEALANVHCPTFVAHGTADHGTEIDHAKALVDVLKAESLITLEGGAHAAAYTHADQLVGPLKAWLDKSA
ncbi:MAG: alpha/beta fold hydrolase, partial [Nannocystaceae bacterium]